MRISWDQVLRTIDEHPGTVGNLLPPVEVDARIRELETAAAHPILETYRNWLHRYEQFVIEASCYVFGINGPGNLFDQQSPYLARGWINIANDGCGNYYALVTTGEFALPEPVIFLDAYAELDECFVVASDFASFIQGHLLKEKEAFHWPFDRDETLQFDPNLAMARKVGFPWDDR